MPPLWRLGGATVGLVADGGPAWPHLWIIWSQIVYLAFLKCYQCFLCAFVSPLEKKKKIPTPPPPSVTCPSGRYTDSPWPPTKWGQINPKDTFHPRPLFPKAVPFQKRTGSSHKGVIQASSVKGNTELLFLGVCCFSPSLPVIPHVFWCLLLPAQKRRLSSIIFSLLLHYLNSNMQRVTQPCGQNLWLKVLTLAGMMRS